MKCYICLRSSLSLSLSLCLSLSACVCMCLVIIMPRPYGRGNKRCFCPSICLSVCPSVAYTANNSRTQRPSVPKYGRKVPHLRCDSHTSFKDKRSNVRVRGERGHTVSAEPGGHTACFETNHQIMNLFIVTLFLRLCSVAIFVLLCVIVTRSSAVAERPRDASCLCTVSYSSRLLLIY